jgi:hypothetical protein
MELVAAIPSALLTIPSDLVHTHPNFESVITLISSRIDAQDSIQEQSSSALVVRQEMGYVYAAWNPLFPDLIKIGATMRAFPIIRVDELSSWAGVPEPFQLVASIAAPDPFALERELHRHFDSVRKYGRKKEFFLVTKEEIGYQFHLRSLQVQRGTGGAIAPKHQDRNRKKTPQPQGPATAAQPQAAKFVRHFIELHIEAASSDTCAFVPTKKIYKAFQRECTAPIIQQMTLIIFSMELAKQIENLLPEARRTRNESCKGYTGILLK